MISPFVRRPNYYETDQMGIIHHSNYIRWFEEARVDFMEKLGYSYERAESSGVLIAVLGVTCDYRSMVRFADTVEIQPVLTALSKTRMTVSYRVIDKRTGELRATGESRHCFLNRDLSPVSLQRAIPELYRLFASCMEHHDKGV